MKRIGSGFIGEPATIKSVLCDKTIAISKYPLFAAEYKLCYAFYKITILTKAGFRLALML